jgi:replication factor C subunit 3/5
MNRSVPWIEFYRPKKMEDIVLNPINRKLFQNILDKNYFPNMLFYGPPGTGKTTTIINLINDYQSRYNGGKSTVIHLNASDERGIDIIRNQINQFVRSRNMFESGFKFVILDEVDYMTKNAQQALKYLLQVSNANIRYCLICNYISKIDESLQNEFICIRFNQLPKHEIHSFIKTIAINENINITEDIIDIIQSNYNSDIRSMINFLQLNQNLLVWKDNIINNSCWIKIHQLLMDPNVKVDEVINFVNNISIKYNMDKNNIIQLYLNYVIRNQHHLCTPLCIANRIQSSDNGFQLNNLNEVYLQLESEQRCEICNGVKKNLITPEFLDIVEKIIHNDTKIHDTLNYFYYFMKKYYSSK